jgi:hypothetical protein
MTRAPRDAAPPPRTMARTPQTRRGHHVPRPVQSRPAGPLDLDLDIDQALDDLRRAFPDLCIWHGEWSGSLWALLPDRLVEARTAADLARRLRSIRSHTGPEFAGPRRPASSTRRPDGTWTVPPTPDLKPIRHGTPARRQWRCVARLLVGCLRLAGLSAWSRTPAW